MMTSSTCQLSTKFKKFFKISKYSVHLLLVRGFLKGPHHILQNLACSKVIRMSNN